MTKPCFWRLLLALLTVMVMPGSSVAQQRVHVHTSAAHGHWDFPVTADSISDMTASDDLKQLLFNVTGETSVPFALAEVDSLTIETDPAEETKNRYKVFQLYITTNDGRTPTKTASST